MKFRLGLYYDVMVVRGGSRDPTGPIFVLVARGRHAAVRDVVSAFWRRRLPVERRPGFKIQTTDQRATRTEWRPTIHLGRPAPTPPVIGPVARISGGPWRPVAARWLGLGCCGGLVGGRDLSQGSVRSLWSGTVRGWERRRVDNAKVWKDCTQCSIKASCELSNLVWTSSLNCHRTRGDMVIIIIMSVSSVNDDKIWDANTSATQHCHRIIIIVIIYSAKNIERQCLYMIKHVESEVFISLP